MSDIVKIILIVVAILVVLAIYSALVSKSIIFMNIMLIISAAALVGYGIYSAYNADKMWLQFLISGAIVSLYRITDDADIMFTHDYEEVTTYNAEETLLGDVKVTSQKHTNDHGGFIKNLFTTVVFFAIPAEVIAWIVAILVGGFISSKFSLGLTVIEAVGFGNAFWGCILCLKNMFSFFSMLIRRRKKR